MRIDAGERRLCELEGEADGALVAAVAEDASADGGLLDVGEERGFFYFDEEDLEEAYQFITDYLCHWIRIKIWNIPPQIQIQFPQQILFPLPRILPTQHHTLRIERNDLLEIEEPEIGHVCEGFQDEHVCAFCGVEGAEEVFDAFLGRFFAVCVPCGNVYTEFFFKCVL